MIYPADRGVRAALQDFSTDHAFKYLDLYRHKYPTFNDDIQGMHPAKARLDTARLTPRLLL